MAQKKTVYVALSVAVSVLLLWLLVSRIEIEDLIQTFTRIHIPALLAYMAGSLTTAGLRACRYKWLLKPQHISWGNIMLVTFIRNSFIDLLPARIGSLIYIYILNRRLNFSFEVAASTFVVAFFLDFLTLSPFLILAVFAVGLGATSISNVSLLLISIFFFLLVLAVLWKIIPLFSALQKVFHALTNRLKLGGKRWAGITAEKIQATRESLAAIQKRKIHFPVFFLSLLIRLGKYVSIYLLLFSILHSHGFSFKNLSFWKMILGITGAELTSALPVKGIAGFGTWESAWTLTYTLMNFEPRLAIISGIGVHLITNLFEYSLGIASLLILALPLLIKKKKGIF